MIKDAYKLMASEALALFASGKLTSVELVKSCLQQITATDDNIHAWVYLDPNSVIAQAEECDRIRKAGLATGPLHGIPVGLKDIIDTADMPTGRGTPVFKGRRSEQDARLVELLREAGALIMGKTITTEVAAASDYEASGGLWYYAEQYHQQYLAKPGARPYCSAQPLRVSLPPFEQWAPSGLEEKHAPKLPEAFWKRHGPKPGCVINSPDKPIEWGEW